MRLDGLHGICFILEINRVVDLDITSHPEGVSCLVDGDRHVVNAGDRLFFGSGHAIWLDVRRNCVLRAHPAPHSAVFVSTRNEAVTVPWQHTLILD